MQCSLGLLHTFGIGLLNCKTNKSVFFKLRDCSFGLLKEGVRLKHSKAGHCCDCSPFCFLLILDLFMLVAGQKTSPSMFAYRQHYTRNLGNAYVAFRSVSNMCKMY